MTTQSIAQMLPAMMDGEDAIHRMGSLLGAICSGKTGALTRWLDETIDAARPGSCDEAGLREAARGACSQLADAALEFDLGLPGDDQPLAERAAALGVWCQGFLFGLINSGVADFAELSPDVSGFLSDVTAIRGAAQDEESEGAEEHFVQLVEYLRVGVQHVYEELVPPPVATPATGRS